ncbi:MAG: CRISPR-associated endonuclease Cas1 [Lachnospiraceae bacterium]
MMITIESVLSKKNQKRALDYLSTRKNGVGIDKVPLSDLREFWDNNKVGITEEIKKGEYSPGLVQEYEIINGRGKKRTLVKFNTIDRFLLRMLSQKLDDFFGNVFLANSMAYQKEKGIQKAVEIARGYIESGNEIVVKVDLQQFFESISHEIVLDKLNEWITDKAVISLVTAFLRCSVTKDGQIYRKDRGLFQGASISPVLSNLYLHSLDEYFEKNGYNWIRFADDIFIFASNEEIGNQIFANTVTLLKKDFGLEISPDKSGVSNAFEIEMLGYMFCRKEKNIIIKRKSYQDKKYYRTWHPCVAERINQEYHIVNNGIINKKDYALLFENDSKKCHIPVEATEQINIYNEIMLTDSVIRSLSMNGIRMALYDNYGDLLGYFVPESFSKDTDLLMKQCEEYRDERKRVEMARKFEVAAFHNLRSNIRYYKKQGRELQETETYLSKCIIEVNEAKTINDLMLIEARGRQKYYQAINLITNREEFHFERRSKRPPLDEINALISFGNTLLYNRIQQIIWKTNLDSRIGVIHAAGKRHHSLNLDFADLFKPLIVDRIIFSLINRGQIGKEDFIKNDDGSVYLSNEGKKIFIGAFEEKMRSRISIEEKQYSFIQIIEREIRLYIHHLNTGEQYKPYKYY